MIIKLNKRNQGILGEMKKKTSNYIVIGFHENTPFPAQAEADELVCRFALILDSYHPKVDYMHFQESLFLACLTEIAKIIDHDTISLHLDSNSYESIEEFSRYLFTIPQEDRRPPQAIFFKKDGNLVCIEETEFWTLCGGDLPYSDSYTASFYTEKNMSDQFVKACMNAAETEENRFEDIIQASSVPVKQSFFKKIRNYLS